MCPAAAGASFWGRIQVMCFNNSPPLPQVMWHSISQLPLPSIIQSPPPHSRADDDEHWSVEFQDAYGNVALMLSGHTRMNLLVCNFVHQARAAQAKP